MNSWPVSDGADIAQSSVREWLSSSIQAMDGSRLEMPALHLGHALMSTSPVSLVI
jgi:hypothetical protein